MRPLIKASWPSPSQDASLNAMTIDRSNQETQEEDEWEYEYSTTETETYYVTLDLTTPDVPAKRRVVQSQEKKKKSDKHRPLWANPGFGKQKRFFPPQPTTFRLQSESESPAPEVPESEIEPRPPPPEPESSDEEETVEKPPDIQMMDIHTKNPIISYDGNIYTCEWASNIGTELLFTKHQEDMPLPYIRTLPGDVDLLAASSARIISKHVKAIPTDVPMDIPRARPRNPNIPDLGRGIDVPCGPGASYKRKDQAKFIEQMMGIKERRGEEDFVTVYAKGRPTTYKWRLANRALRNSERSDLQRYIERRGRKDLERVEQAKRRLEEMDEEDRKVEEEDRERGLSKGGKKPVKMGDKRHYKKPKQEEHEVAGGGNLIGADELVVLKRNVIRRRRGRAEMLGLSMGGDGNGEEDVDVEGEDEDMEDESGEEGATPTGTGTGDGGLSMDEMDSDDEEMGGYNQPMSHDGEEGQGEQDDDDDEEMDD